MGVYRTSVRSGPSSVRELDLCLLNSTLTVVDKLLHRILLRRGSESSTENQRKYTVSERGNHGQTQRNGTTGGTAHVVLARLTSSL